MNEPIVFIPLTRGKIAIIDFLDFDRVRAYRWHAVKSGQRFYAMSRVNGDRVYLHRFIISEEGRDTAHKNGDGLNCCRGNLKIMSRQRNLQGHQRKKIGATSQFRGVSWDTRLKKWAASIQVERKKKHLGLFEAELDAARAYDSAAKKYFGKFSYPNFQ